MAEKHLTDSEISELSGAKPRVHPAVPKATCLNCGQSYQASYASFACDCRIDLAERIPYAHWLKRFQRWGMGVLKNPSDAKFPFQKIISGRTMLTYYLQSDISVGHREELDEMYYHTEPWKEAGFASV